MPSPKDLGFNIPCCERVHHLGGEGVAAFVGASNPRTASEDPPSTSDGKGIEAVRAGGCSCTRGGVGEAAGDRVRAGEAAAVGGESRTPPPRIELGLASAGLDGAARPRRSTSGSALDTLWRSSWDHASRSSVAAATPSSPLFDAPIGDCYTKSYAENSCIPELSPKPLVTLDSR